MDIDRSFKEHISLISNDISFKYIKQTLTKVPVEIDKCTIIVGDFSILSLTEKSKSK